MEKLDLENIPEKTVIKVFELATNHRNTDEFSIDYRDKTIVTYGRHGNFPEMIEHVTINLVGDVLVSIEGSVCSFTHNQHEIQKLLEPFWIEEEPYKEFNPDKHTMNVQDVRDDIILLIKEVNKIKSRLKLSGVSCVMNVKEPEIDLSDGWFNDIERFINSVKVMGTINVCSDGNALKRAISYFTELQDIKQKMREER